MAKKYKRISWVKETEVDGSKKRKRYFRNVVDVWPDTKKCRKCGEVKPASEFYPNERLRDGLHCYCKKCVYEETKKYGGGSTEYKRKRREELKEYARKRTNNNL